MCSYIFRVTKTKLTCTTSAFDGGSSKNATRKRRFISSDEKLTVLFNSHSAIYGVSVPDFKYIPDPIITDITPRVTFPRYDVIVSKGNGVVSYSF